MTKAQVELSKRVARLLGWLEPGTIEHADKVSSVFKLRSFLREGDKWWIVPMPHGRFEGRKPNHAVNFAACRRDLLPILTDNYAEWFVLQFKPQNPLHWCASTEWVTKYGATDCEAICNNFVAMMGKISPVEDRTRIK